MDDRPTGLRMVDWISLTTLTPHSTRVPRTDWSHPLWSASRLGEDPCRSLGESGSRYSGGITGSIRVS